MNGRNWMPVKVGQEVYVVHSRRTHGGNDTSRVDTITSLGNKWAYLGKPSRHQQRFNIATGWLDGRGYSSASRVWPSQETYELSLALGLEWRELQKAIQYVEPQPGVTLDDVRKARELLKL